MPCSSLHSLGAATVEGNFNGSANSAEEQDARQEKRGFATNESGRKTSHKSYGHGISRHLSRRERGSFGLRCDMDVVGLIGKAVSHMGFCIGVFLALEGWVHILYKHGLAASRATCKQSKT